MTDAYIYDAVRSPRGKGRPDGSLHELTSVALSAKLDLQSGRPPMYPGRKSSQAHQSLVCYDGPNQTGTQIT